MSRLFSSTGFNSNFPTSIYVILIWESHPTTSFPHTGWTESKINKSDTRLVIFVSKFFKRQKLKGIFSFFSKHFLIVEAELPCAHACNILHVLSKTKKNAKYLFQSWENLISDGTFATPTELVRETVFLWLRGKENLINSVVYCKKKHHGICQCLYGTRYQSLTLLLVNFQRRGERWVARLA